jgi:tripartite-type tricarboxylate transporter receptor subunit TctC
MAMELFKSMAGVKLTHIPYKGTGPGLSDLIAGQIPMMFGNILSCLPHVKAERLRALGVSSARRSAAIPATPTIRESGLPGYVDTTWHGWLAPAGTPRSIVMRLSSEIAKAVKSPDIVEKIASDGGEAIGSTPEEFSRLLGEEIARWRKVARAADVRVE